MPLMDETGPLVAILLAGLVVLVALVGPKLSARLALSRAKHRSLAGHSRLSRRIAALVPRYAYDDAQFFRADDAGTEIADRRRAGFERLSRQLRTTGARTLEPDRRGRPAHLGPAVHRELPRALPVQPARQGRVAGGSFVASSHGVQVTDLDGNRPLRSHRLLRREPAGLRLLQGLHGARRPARRRARPGAGHLSVAGRRQRRAAGADIGQGRGLVPHVGDGGGHAGRAAGALSHQTLPSRALLRRLSRLVGRRAARRRQPGARPRHLHPGRHVRRPPWPCCAAARDIACVLVNPVQAMHPNLGAPADSTLVHSRPDRSVDRAAYAAWLKELRAVCSARGIVLIFDEVFLGFRLAPGGAQEYFGVEADIVTYGKTVGGGFPIGVVCGRHRFMKRFRDDRPADICFARGTFNSHPYVMAAMNEFLLHLETPEMQALYRDLDATWDAAHCLAQSPARRARPAAAGGAALVGLDRLLHGLVALQLDVPVLPQGSGPGVELDRHRPADVQPEFQRGRLRGGGRALPRRRRGDAPRRLVRDRRARHRQGHQAPHPARDAWPCGRPSPSGWGGVREAARRGRKHHIAAHEPLRPFGPPPHRKRWGGTESMP